MADFEKNIESDAPVSGKMHYVNPRMSRDKRHSLASDTEKGMVMDASGVEGKPMLARKLKSRHMQMIAIGGSIGAGLFVGSGSALQSGGPASLVIGFIIIGVMLLCTVQSLGEMAVVYPVNGAFFTYSTRFLDRSWGFAMGWNYAIGWLTILPFEITAAGITIQYWRDDINIGVWITVFLFALCMIQIFGVRGYGEVEFFLSLIKVTACIGFIIFGIIVDCGGVPTDNRGYIGGRYWNNPGAFRNGFRGFCSVFVTAAFAFGGTELVGLAAAEAADPRKTIPRASKQVFWRITLFYVLNLLMVGLILPSDDQRLLGSSGANTKASPFVLAIQMAGVKALPSIFNVVITISVLSVANSCTYASSRTLQALAERGMAPPIFTYIDKKGRPLPAIILQLCFGLLAFINEANVGDDFFTWLLSLSGLAYFFAWGSINASYIRWRAGWRAHGKSLDEIPWRSPLGVPGAAVGLFLNIIALIATFYTALFPKLDAQYFFQQYLAAVIVLACYVAWKVWTRDWSMFIRAHEMDVDSGRREIDLEPLHIKEYTGFMGVIAKIYRGLC
ncbi:MAG: hypothetical protein Q9227_008737 [Pyrenula ochraceoflavens]